MHLHYLCYAAPKRSGATLGWELPRGAEATADAESPDARPDNIAKPNYIL